MALLPATTVPWTEDVVSCAKTALVAMRLSAAEASRDERKTDFMKVPLIMPKRALCQVWRRVTLACSPGLRNINDGLMTLGPGSCQIALSVTFLPCYGGDLVPLGHLDPAAAPQTALSRASRPQP